MPTIPFADWIRRHKIKKRDAYRLIEKGLIKPIKEKRMVTQTREMWVMCVDESVKP